VPHSEPLGKNKTMARAPKVACRRSSGHQPIADKDAPLQTWPALIAAVTDLARNVTGVLRTGVHAMAPPRRL
jgi:hypothetical protein